jgi:hypothetical protein
LRVEHISVKLHISYEHISGLDLECIFYQSKKRVSIATATTIILPNPRPWMAESASDVEPTEVELELALPAEAAIVDEELLLLVTLVEDLETEDCEAVWIAVDEAVSEAIIEA